MTRTHHTIIIDHPGISDGYDGWVVRPRRQKYDCTISDDNDEVVIEYGKGVNRKKCVFPMALFEELVGLKLKEKALANIEKHGGRGFLNITHSLGLF